MRFVRLILACIAAALAIVPGAASAAVIMPISMTFATGGNFSGTITMNDSLDQLLGVSGTLYGYSSTNLNYVPGNTDSFNTVMFGGGRWWEPASTANPNQFLGYIANDTPYWPSNMIRLVIDFSDPVAPVLLPQYQVDQWWSVGAGMTNNGAATMSGGTVSIASGGMVGGVPEPSTWLLFILGFGGIAAVLRSQKRAGRMALRFSYG